MFYSIDLLFMLKTRAAIGQIMDGYWAEHLICTDSENRTFLAPARSSIGHSGLSVCRIREGFKKNYLKHGIFHQGGVRTQIPSFFNKMLRMA
jgi:hypothetical protein